VTVTDTSEAGLENLIATHMTGLNRPGFAGGRLV